VDPLLVVPRVRVVVHLVCRFDFRVSGSGFRVSGSGFRVPGSGFRVPGFGFRVPGLEFGVVGVGDRGWGAGFRVEGLGLGVTSESWNISVEISLACPRQATRHNFSSSLLFSSLELSDKKVYEP